jgi:hypothetical protein
MERNEITFPQYRKYKNNRSYFKISDWDTFEEVQHLPGNRYQSFHFKANILPDRNFVQDMVTDYEAHWDKIEASVFEEVLAKCKP